MPFIILLSRNVDNFNFHFKEYIHPRQYQDPRQKMIDQAFQEKKAKIKQGKFKATVKHKPCFIDEFIKPIKDYPSPQKYKTQKNIAKRYKSASLSKVDMNVKKRTFLDEIEHFSKKYKPPGVGKYNLINPEKKKNKFKQTVGNKICHLDNIAILSSQVPGPGSHNPHIEVKKLKINTTDYQFFKEKHQQQNNKLKRALSCKLGPTTYTPITYNTLDSYKHHKSGDKTISRWSHGQIDIRKGMRSSMKHPSSADYDLVNQWVKLQNKDQNFGKYRILDKYTKSTQNFNVYH